MPLLVLLALEKHLFPESVPLLVQFLGDEFWQFTARRTLREIVGKDLRREVEAWLKKYKAQKKSMK